MKNTLILLFTLLNLSAYSQISIELFSGVGLDISKFETKYTNNRTPLTHSYTYGSEHRDVEFTILEPQQIGGRFLWKFSKKLDLSIGTEFKYIKRDIIGTFYSETKPINSVFSEMDIDIEYYSYAFLLRKNIKINEKNQLFIQPSIYATHYTGGKGYFSSNEGIERIPVKNRQLVQYKEDEAYRNLIEIDPSGGFLNNFQFTQGYLMQLTNKLQLGVSSSVSFDKEPLADFLIWGWNVDEQRKAFGWSPNSLKFTSVMFDLFLTYEF